MDPDERPAADPTSLAVPSAWDARTYLHLLRRSLGLIFVVTLLVAVPLTVWSATRPDVYRATASLYLPSSASSVTDIASGDTNRADAERATRTEIGLMESRTVEAAAQAAVSGKLHVVVQTAGDSDLVKVVASAGSPERAVRHANAYAAAYLKVRSDLETRSLLEAGSTLQDKIRELDDRSTAYQAQLDGLDAVVLAAAPETRAAVTQSQAGDRARVRSQLDSIANQRSYYVAQQDRLEVARNLGGVSGARLVDRAEAPSHRVSPKPLRDGVLAVLLGLVLGISAALVRDQLDDSVRDDTDLARITTAAVLGSVPRVPSRRLPTPRAPLQSLDPATPEAESFRTLRTSLDFVSFEEPVRTLLVSSAQANEGKTLCTASLGMAYARAGVRVLVVSCDLRRPSTHELFGVDGTVGLSSVLVGSAEIDQAIRPVPDTTGLYVLPSGPVPPNPAELLGSDRMARLVDGLRETFDLVLLDSPPILPVVDALQLGQLADGVLLVVREGVTSRRALQRALRSAERVGLRIVGVVMNGGTAHHGYGYGGGRYAGYGPSAGGRRSRRPVEVDRPPADSSLPTGGVGAAGRR